MIETPTLRSPYSLKQSSQFLSPIKSVGPHESPSSNRFKTPIRVRKLESQREMHTEILQISQYSPDSSSQASKLPSITPVNRKRLSKRTLSNIESSVFKDNGKSMITIKDDKVIPISKLLSIQTEESIIASSPSRKAKVTLKPIETRRKRDVSGGGRDGNGSLSPRSMERISEHLKLESFVNRDIAEVMEPIAQKNSQKVRKINKMISERDGGMGKSPKSKFEEEIFDAVKRRFIRDKLESELRVIKPMHSEKFTLAAKEEAYFKLSTRNLKFPLQGKVLSKAPTSSYEIFASTKATKPRLDDCEYHFTGNKFLIEAQARIDCIYFTLLAITDLEAKLWILPDTGRKISEEEGPEEQSPSNIMRDSPTEIIQNVPENLKNKYVRLYPFVSYTPDQMEDFVGEIKQLKAEREVKTRKLAKEERDIIASNTDGVKKFNKGQLLEKIREFNKIKKEAREVIAERRDKMEYEDKIKKLIVQKKDEIKQEVQKDFIEETKNGELRRERRIFWVSTVCQNFIFNEIAGRIWEFRAHRLITKIRNRSAILIQKAYERYIFKKGNNKLLRNIVDLRQSLYFLSQMITKQAHKKATKVAKTFLTEYPLLQMITIKTMRFNVSVRKIQRMAKRHYVMRRFQRLVLSQMIQDIITSANLVTEGGTIDDINTLKNTKKGKGEKGKKIKSKPVEKEKEKPKMRDFISGNKQKNPLREQFDKALLISLDIRNIVVEAYLEEVIQQNKRKYRQEREKLNKLPHSIIQEEEKRNLYDEIDETNADNLKETCCTLVRISSGSTISQEDRNFVFDTKESSFGNSTLINSQKMIGRCPASIKAISREGLSTFMDENYVGIAKSVKSKGDSNLLWLFN